MKSKGTRKIMEEDRIKKALKFSMILFEIMFFIAVYWLVCSRISVWEQVAVLRSLGIFTGVVFLFLCPIAPVCGVICGCAGYFGLKKMASKHQRSKDKKMWKILALAEILLGLIMILPCMMLFLAACSGQI